MYHDCRQAFLKQELKKTPYVTLRFAVSRNESDVS